MLTAQKRPTVKSDGGLPVFVANRVVECPDVGPHEVRIQVELHRTGFDGIGPEIATRRVEQLFERMTRSRRVAFGPEVRLNTLPRHASLSPKCEKGQEAHAPPLQRSRWDGPVSRRES